MRPIIMALIIKLIFCIFFIATLMTQGPVLCPAQESPLSFIKARELKKRDSRGVVHLGVPITLNYQVNSVKVDPHYYPQLLELTDALKIPSRENYFLILKGYTDNTGSPEINSKISMGRAEGLKRLLIERYYLTPERIKAEGLGSSSPAASNETPEGRRLNRRVDVHVYGDVSESVKFIEKLEAKE